MQFRLAHHGSIQTCHNIIKRRYGRKMEEQWEELKGRSVVPSSSVDIDTCMTTGEWKDPRGTNHATAIENNSVWECTGTLEEHAEISRELLTELPPRCKSPRERRRESREVAKDFEQIKLVQGSVASAFKDSSVCESFPNTKTKQHTEGQSLKCYDKSAYEDQTESEASKEQHPEPWYLAGLDQGQTSNHRKWMERLDRIPAGNTKETLDTAKEYRRFTSIQDCTTNSELGLDEKTNRQLSVNEGSHQMLSEKREKGKRLKRSATQKRGEGKVQQCDIETGNRRSVNIAQREIQGDSETHDLNREQLCSGGMTQWQCEACTLVNKPSESICRACNRSRNCADEKPLKTGGRQCNQCTFVNSSTAQKCEICDSDLIGSSTYV